MLELSLRGDRGLLGLRTLWKTDCTLPLQSCKKKYLPWCKEIKIGVNLRTYININRELIDRQIDLTHKLGHILFIIFHLFFLNHVADAFWI